MNVAERLDGKQIIRDAHLVQVGIGGKRQQSGMLRLPAKPPYALLTGGLIYHNRGATLDPVAILVAGIGKREDRLVRNRLHQANAEYGNRDAMGDDVRFFGS